MNLSKSLFISLFAIISFSCKKNLEQESAIGSSNAFINISLDQSKDQNANSSQSFENSNKSLEQKFIQELGPELAVEATLTPVTENRNNISLNKLAENVCCKNELENDVKIKIFVFDAKGNYFKSLIHSYKKGSNTIEIKKLNIGEKYTFIAYSINSKTDIPKPVDSTKLTNLAINNLNTEFMLQKQDVTIKVGGNTVNLEMKHRFSEVFTTIEADQTDKKKGSKITQVTNPRITGGYEKANFNLNKETISFLNKLNSPKELKLINNTIGTNTILSESIFLLSDGSESTFEIPSLTINGMTQSINIPKISIQPGVRYNLKLKVSCPCLANATQSSDFEVPLFGAGVVSAPAKPLTFTFPNSDYGAVIDFYQIDNSFNLTINTTQLYTGKQNNIETNEIQFQGFNQYERDLKPNIEFADGSRWGRENKGGSTPATIDEIFSMNGLSTKSPIIKIYIDKNGKVTMYGSKNKAGGSPYYPLKLINQTLKFGNVDYEISGSFSSSIKWNSGSNTVVLSQKPDYETLIYGRITGKQIIDCPQ